MGGREREGGREGRRKDGKEGGWVGGRGPEGGREEGRKGGLVGEIDRE